MNLCCALTYMFLPLHFFMFLLLCFCTCVRLCLHSISFCPHVSCPCTFLPSNHVFFPHVLTALTCMFRVLVLFCTHIFCLACFVSLFFLRSHFLPHVFRVLVFVALTFSASRVSCPCVFCAHIFCLTCCVLVFFCAHIFCLTCFVSLRSRFLPSLVSGPCTFLSSHTYALVHSSPMIMLTLLTRFLHDQACVCNGMCASALMCHRASFITSSPQLFQLELHVHALYDESEPS